MPVGGGPTLALASGLPGIGAASAVWDGQFIYFAGFFNGTIYRIPVAGGALVPLATGQSYPSSLVLDGTKLFWGTDSQILSLDLSADGGAPTPIAESPQSP